MEFLTTDVWISIQVEIRRIPQVTSKDFYASFLLPKPDIWPLLTPISISISYHQDFWLNSFSLHSDLKTISNQYAMAIVGLN